MHLKRQSRKNKNYILFYCLLVQCSREHAQMTQNLSFSYLHKQINLAGLIFFLLHLAGGRRGKHEIQLVPFETLRLIPDAFIYNGGFGIFPPWTSLTGHCPAPPWTLPTCGRASPLNIPYHKKDFWYGGNVLGPDVLKYVKA